MNGWSTRERRWRDALLAAMIPASTTEPRHPGLAELDTEPFWNEMERAAPPLLRLGLRVAVWLLTWAPLLLLGRARSFAGLARPQQDRLLEQVATSRWYLLRQLVTTLKAVACLAYFRDPSTRPGFEPNDEGRPPVRPESTMAPAEGRCP